MAVKRDKQVVPKSPAQPRQNKVVVPRWEVIPQEDSDRVVLRAEHFRRKDGTFDEVKLFQAKQAYPGKKWGVELKEGNIVYRPKNLYFSEDGNSLKAEGQLQLSRAMSEGNKSMFYNPPSRDPTAAVRQGGDRPKTPAVAPKTATKMEVIGKHPKYPDIKTSQVKILENGKWVEKGKPTMFADTANGRRTVLKDDTAVRQHIANKEFDKLKQSFQGSTTKEESRAAMKQLDQLKKTGLLDKSQRRQIRTMRSISTALDTPKKIHKPAPPPKVVVKKRRAGQVGRRWNGKQRLKANQYVGPRGIIRSSTVARVQQRQAAAQTRVTRANAAALKKEALGRIKSFSKFNAHKQFQVRDRARRIASSRTYRANISAKNQSAFTARLQKLSGFGKAPVKLLMSGKQWAKRAPGKIAAMKGMDRATMYPAMNHSGASPLRAPVSMRSLGGRQTLIEPEKQSRVKGTTLFGTERTLSTGRFPYGGQGVFFRIDAEQVLANLSIRYPAAIRKGVVRASEAVGRKLLDIVEPYVPKDTGLMYTTAKTNSGQTASGGVSMEDGEGYAEAEMSGVSISYNTPYAEIVYFDEEAAHGEAYNRKHKTSEKGEKETARWIEVAFEQEGAAIKGLLGEYAAAVTMALSGAGGARIRNG